MVFRINVCRMISVFDLIYKVGPVFMPGSAYRL